MNVLDVVGEWALLDGPLYQRLAAALRNAVSRGDLPPGTILPAERHLARALAVGRSTVVGAYDVLRSEGILVSKQGSGTWVSGADRNAASRGAQLESLGRAALSGGEDLIDLATASLPAAPAVAEALANLGELARPLLSQTGYSALGLLELRRAVATMFSNEGLPTHSDQILITTGDQQALSLISELLLDTGDGLVVEDPTSAGLLDVARKRPVVLRSAPSLSVHGSAPMLSMIAKTAPRLVYTISSLGPEGAVADRDELRSLARGLRGFEGTIVEDTSSRHLVPDSAPPYLAALTADAPVLTIGSMSKLFWGGLRVGWIRGDENQVLRLSRAKARADLGTPMISQLTSAWLLHRLAEVKSQRHDEIAERSRAAIQALHRVLPGFEARDAQGAVSLWVRLPRGASVPFGEVARRNGVAIVAGASLSVDGGSDNCIRLSLGASPSAFEDGVERLARAWAEYEAHGTPTMPINETVYV